ncbi:phosphoenolpyruvate carboxylase [Streptomyces sp. M10(2022)]
MAATGPATRERRRPDPYGTRPRHPATTLRRAGSTPDTRTPILGGSDSAVRTLLSRVASAPLQPRTPAPRRAQPLQGAAHCEQCRPDPAASPELRADIRRLGDLLGETLVRQEGQDLLDLVERVRALTRTDGEAAAQLLGDTDLETAAQLVRAFSTYFHLANVTEQVHRAHEMRDRRAAEGGLLARTADRLKDADPEHLRETVKNLNVRPVFTAHPTEAARRSVLNKLRRIAALLETPVIEADRRRHDLRLAENIDLIWQTDELRVVRPEPADEARNAIYYLDELHANAVGDVLEDLAAELERVGVELPAGTRPLTFGTWIGGDRDGNPNVTPAVTWEVLILQHEHGITDALELIDYLRGLLSNSIRYTGATDELLTSLQTDLERLPEISPATSG